MNDIDIIAAHYRKLISLMEEEIEQMRKASEGDLYEEYKKTVRIELGKLKNAMHLLRP